MATGTFKLSQAGAESVEMPLSGSSFIATANGFVYNLAGNMVVDAFSTGNQVNMPDGKAAFYGTRAEAETFGLDFTWYDENM